jgi:hypothetical protein
LERVVLRRILPVVAILSAGIMVLAPESSAAQSAVDISVTGGADAQRIVVIPRSGPRSVVLSLQGALSWTNSQGQSPGWFRYRWGLLDGGGKFLSLASEEPAHVRLGATDNGFTQLAVDRSLLVAPSQPGAAPDKDFLIAIRIEECGFDPPDPTAQARCTFSGTVKALAVQ